MLAAAYSDVPPTTDNRRRKVDARRRDHNREQLLLWLTHYNNRFGSSGVETIINFQALPKPNPSFGPLDNQANLDRLDSYSQSLTDKVLHTILNILKRRHWHLYMHLHRAYLDPDASPSIVEDWRLKAEAGELGAKMAYGYHCDAVERILDMLPDGFLIIISHKLQSARTELDAARQKRRHRARLKFFEYEKELGTSAAVTKVEKEEGYSRREVFRLISKSSKKKSTS